MANDQFRYASASDWSGIISRGDRGRPAHLILIDRCCNRYRRV